VPVADGMTFDLGNSVSFRVVETLGHASHHQSYYEPFAGKLFPGDAAGIYLRQLDVVVPTIPAPFRLDAALASLEKLVSLNPSALCYSHFGMATNTVERLKAYPQQLKLWVSVAEKGVRNNQTFEVIRDKIVETDSSISRALELMKAHPILGITVLNNSVWGAIKYAEKFCNVSVS
jgi:glyoxylase-like metal-dependent hydrolase (beta-lactamase superfamily II)